MVQYNFKSIAKVPTAKEFVDVILSKTQRKTPTVVRAAWKISRVREFYMRKVRFTQQNYHEKLSTILDQFPKLDELHPFYSSLVNVLYSRDHYKLALGQINTARSLIDNLAKDYLRMLKFGDSLYRCKQLKRAAMGRMCTIMKKLHASLGYLEEVRQHLARLPTIDPTTRTIIITGYPNVGKSSFINKVSRANVEVQPYAFTTKSIFVGHIDHRYLRWQVIDTPGILDHPLEERNTIEMQAITALAHLQSCVLYFIDISETCGYSIKQQVSLYHSIKPLFSNKPMIVVATKTDLRKIEDLDAEDQSLIDTIRRDRDCQILTMSNISEEGISQVKTIACDTLLQFRVDRKAKKLGSRTDDVLNRVHVARPVPRDDKPRPVSIPDTVVAERKSTEMGVEKEPRRLERDIESEQGGPGVYNADIRKYYLLNHDDWKWDIIPEIMDGKNIADFVDPDIDAKLAELEREEEELEAKATEEADMEESDLDDETMEKVTKIRSKRAQMKLANLSKATRSRVTLPRKATARGRNIDDVEAKLSEIGLDGSKLRARSKSRTSSLLGKRARSKTPAPSEDTNTDEKSGSAVRAQSVTRGDGFRNVKQKVKANKLAHLSQKDLRLQSRMGEGDRHVYTKMPKHLFTGKRGIGKTDRR